MKNQAMQDRFLTLLIGALLSLLLLVTVPWACAQNSSNDNGNNGNSNSADNASRTVPGPLDQSYASSLNNGQAIPMTQGASSQQGYGTQTSALPELHSEFLYGADASTVYVGHYTTTNINHFVSGVVSPYLGIFFPTRTGGVTLQYMGTYAPDDPFTNDFQAYHRLALKAVGAFSRRWYWGIDNVAGYGSESARFQGPLSYSLVGYVPVVDPLTSGLFLVGRNSASMINAFDLGWRRTERDRIQLKLFHTYTDISAASVFPATHENTVGARLDYIRDVTPRFKFDVDAQDERVVENTCNIYSAGVGISAQLSYSWHLDANGGPQRTSGSCGIQTNGYFYGTLVKALRGQARVYALGSYRYFSTTFPTPNTYTDTAAVGFVQPIGRLSVGGDAGYLRAAPLVIANQAFQGYFVAPLVRYKITETTFISAGYRIFHPTAGNLVPGNLNYAQISLEWRPRPKVLSQ